MWGMVVVLLTTPPPGQPSPLPTAFWLAQAGVLVLLALIFYANLLWAIPRLLFRRRTLLYVTLGVGAVAGVLLAHQQLQTWLRVPELLAQAREDALNVNPWCAPRPHVQLGPQDEPSLFNASIFLTTLLVLGVGLGTSAAQKAQQDAQLRRELEQARLMTELDLLKAQINPHFFFNTLNNIYSLTLIDADQARAALHRLSRMMRYVLYDSPAETTLLSQEVSFLRDYMELMQLRLTDEVTVRLEVDEPLREASIAPMLLQPYVENAFKHGVSANAPSRITVAVRQPTPQTLELEVRNTLFPKRAGSLSEAGGIGLVNTQRRLDLLYSGRHTLTVTNCTPEQEYRVLLQLHLS
jgi:two-component sensor histidine kinase